MLSYNEKGCLVQTFKYSGVVFTVKSLYFTKINATEDVFRCNFYEKMVLWPDMYKRLRLKTVYFQGKSMFCTENHGIFQVI